MKQKDILQLIKTDHETVKMLFGELEETTERAAKKRNTLITRIMTEVTIHAKCEEEIFYPAFKQISSEEEEEAKMFFEANEEHHLVKIVMAEFEGMDTATAEFMAKAKVLKDLIEHHAKEEEKEMFKLMKREYGKEDLMELGQQFENRKMELMSELSSKSRARGKKAA